MSLLFIYCITITLSLLLWAIMTFMYSSIKQHLTVLQVFSMLVNSCIPLANIICPMLMLLYIIIIKITSVRAHTINKELEK